ncbi:aminodeoxychorismate synthase component I [Desulfofundulus thermobenzoicus]|uniref:aminodeoxychorismate synthase component I n=1 Tax=Desulfofundulus thermobenzoicus TaxID=29376 RepID=UPI001FA9A4F8|nr:aminodeoxychorismate synthase component I [Desulfofundulus thermobenzoicus]
MTLRLPLMEKISLPANVPALFERLAARPYSFLLDSGLIMPGLGRYSLMGANPFLVLYSRGERLWLEREGKITLDCGHPLDKLKKVLARYRLHPENCHLPFCGGAVGYFSYDLGRVLEKLPSLATDDLQTPDLCLGFYDVVTVVDRVTGEVWVVSTGFPETDPAAAGRRARERLEEMHTILAGKPEPQAEDHYLCTGEQKPAFKTATPPAGTTGFLTGTTESKGHNAGGLPVAAPREAIQLSLSPVNDRAASRGSGLPTERRGGAGSQTPFLHAHFDEDGYCRAVQRAKDYIAAGDIYVINLSQRFSLPRLVEPWPLYRQLRAINPAPMAAYLNFGPFQVVCCSMERFLKVTGRRVETRPIKGTRPRGKDPASDARFREELWHSEKDRAELVMIVDMERNDLGRVCRTGSVQVPQLYRLEEYATVFHLVSTVVGELAPDKDVVDLLAAAFPGGSISGAPKIRAMEIIEELEPVRRGIYTGSIGYIGFNGNADLNIVIRTLIFKDGHIYFQAGGGITIDSDPCMEYMETLDKARALVQGLDSVTGVTGDGVTGDGSLTHRFERGRHHGI